MERSIEDLAVPAGMSPYDTAAFNDQRLPMKMHARNRIRAIHTVKARIKTRCLNYAISVERQLQAQQKSASFMHETHTDVNNFFKVHSDDVYTKLTKAAQLLDSRDPEDHSLLLTQVRRAIKASADYFYPAADAPVTCTDGTVRTLGDEQFLNRLQEYLASQFKKSSSRQLLQAEWEYLSVFARKLNDVASKGVHAEVSAQEAKQGLLGLYMFLSNVVAYVQKAEAAKGT